MTALEKNIAAARGEALAARLLASVTLQTLFAMIPVEQREKVLSGIAAFVDDTLNMSGPGKGDPNDEPNTHIREIARFQAQQHLDAIKRMIDSAPK